MNAFIITIKSRLNTSIGLKSIFIGLTIASVITLLWGLSHILRGFAVSSSFIYPMGMIVAILVGVLHWSRKKKNILQAAIFADKFFNLKDSLTSALEFEKNQSLPIYELQKKQASERIQDLNPRAVPLHISKKLICSAVVGVISTASLAFIPPSPEVREKIAEREMTGSRTKEIKEALETKIEEMIQDLSHAEKKEIPPNTIRQWVSEIKQTPDRREALRHIARAEQKIQRSIDQLQNRKNEALLKKAGLSMLKVSDAKIKAIGKQLKNNELKKAAQSLAKFKFNKESKKDSNPKTKFNDKLKKLAELREFTKRLDQASQKDELNEPALDDQQLAEQLEQLDINKRPEDFDLNDLKQLPKELLNRLPADFLDRLPAGLLNQLPPEFLDQLLEMLDQHAMELQQSMEEMKLEQLQGEELSEEELEQLYAQLSQMDADLDALGNMLKRMQAMKQMRIRLQGLQQNLGLAQGYANGSKSKTQFKMQMQQKGGRLPGLGSDKSRRKDKDKLTNNEQYSKLNGQKGTGPSQSSIEETNSGTGTSKRKGLLKKRTFQHQMSSFIEREDVSEEMKRAVKQYFQDIHHSTNEK